MSFQQVGPFGVFCWSIAGNETCVAVKCGRSTFGFDIGFSPRPMVAADHVFISHGHTDHIGAIAQHMKKRDLNNLPKAIYFMPEHLVPHVRKICQIFQTINGSPTTDFNDVFIATSPGSRHQLPNNWVVEVFETDHAVPSVGYILYSRSSNGQEVPEVAYLGDTRFSVLKDADSICPNLLKVRLLIMEATFLDDPETRVARARSRGHTHLHEIKQNADLFRFVGKIYLMHFSDRYSANVIERLCRTGMPDWLADRIVPSLTAKQCLDML